TALAQSDNSSSASGSQGASSSQTPPASSDMGAGQASKKTKEKNASHEKNGGVVGGNDELPKHVGHEVKLTGTWASAKDIGEDMGKAPQQGKQMESKLKHFKVDSIQHVSDTCKMKPGGTKQGASTK